MSVANYKLTPSLASFYSWFKLLEVIFDENIISYLKEEQSAKEYRKYIDLINAFGKYKNYDYVMVLWEMNPEILEFYNKLYEIQ